LAESLPGIKNIFYSHCLTPDRKNGQL
jgi:hypothetical protein